MDTQKKKITLQLNEHDAAQVLALIKKELHKSDEIWETYWKRLALEIEQSIEHSSHHISQSCHP